MVYSFNIAVIPSNRNIFYKVLYIINYFIIIAYTLPVIQNIKMEKQLSHQESLQLITEMISNAKRNLAKGGSFYFLLWGAVVALANFVIYYLINFTEVNEWYWVWLVTVPAVIITIVHARMTASKATVTGPIDHLYGQIWIGIFIAMVITLVFMARINYAVNPIMLIYSGIGTYITGRLSRFQPLIIGSMVLWAAAIIVFLTPVTYQFLIAGLGFVAGYVVPGLMLRKQEK